MPKPYSYDLRQKVIQAIELDGMNKTEAAQVFQISLFCHFPSILNKRIKRKNSLQVSRAMDVELQILKHLARDAHPRVALVDEYCAEYKDLFKEVRNYECFKYLHLGIISTIKRKSLPEIAKVVSINGSIQFWKIYHF